MWRAGQVWTSPTSMLPLRMGDVPALQQDVVVIGQVGGWQFEERGVKGEEFALGPSAPQAHCRLIALTPFVLPTPHAQVPHGRGQHVGHLGSGVAR